jgi:hypothetical protein
VSAPPVNAERRLRQGAADLLTAAAETTITDPTDTTAYIRRQAQGVRVWPLEIDWDAEIRYWMAVYSRATR